MKFTDTHAHLYDAAFDSDIEEIIEKSVSCGVEKIIFPDIDSSTRERMFTLADRYPDMFYPCLGLHPTSINSYWETEFEKIRSIYYSGRTGNSNDNTDIRRSRIYAIGETGIDCHWSKEFIEEQKTAFKKHIELAHQYNLPLIIHSRDATEITLDIIETCKKFEPRGVFHAFSGSEETFKNLRKIGDWYVGIGGVVTFKNASIASTLRNIPLERILLETDSPYLSPVPYRGKRNDSSNIPLIARKIAEIKNVSVEEVAETTSQNAKKIFDL